MLFDTGVLVDFLVGDRRVMNFFDEYVYQGELTPVISSQTVAELFMATRDKREEIELDRWISALFDVSDVTPVVAKQAGILKRSNGIRAGDSVIASTALTLNVPLVTTTPEAYRKAGLRVFKPYV